MTAPAATLVKSAGNSIATFTVVAHHSNPNATLYYQWMKDWPDVAIQGATSSTYVIDPVTTDDSNIYWCKITNNVDDNVALSNFTVLASSILDNIELNIKVAILGMTVIGGYNWDWQTVNQPDEAIGDFPRALIASPAETCKDDPNGPNAQAYTNEVLFVIDVKGNQAWSNNANFTIRSNLRTALDDLKMLFGNNSSVNDSCFEIMYRSSQIIPLNQNDIQRPGYMRTQWMVRYGQDRLNPMTVASS